MRQDCQEHAFASTAYKMLPGYFKHQLVWCAMWRSDGAGGAHQEDPRGFVAKLSGYGLRDLGTDIATRMEVCMYRTVAHLPPETLLKNEVTEVRARSGARVCWQVVWHGVYVLHMEPLLLPAPAGLQAFLANVYAGVWAR